MIEKVKPTPSRANPHSVEVKMKINVGPDKPARLIIGLLYALSLDKPARHIIGLLFALSLDKPARLRFSICTSQPK